MHMLEKRKILSHKNFVKATFFSKKRCFHEIFVKIRKNCEKRVNFHTVWKLRNFTATVFSQIFRQINVLLKNFTVNQFDEKKLRGSEFLVFPHCVKLRI